MECTIKWLDGMSFVAETGSGHIVAMDGAPEAGGRNLAPRPMEMMLAGAGGCTAFDVMLILKRSRQDVRDCTVHLAAERADTDPKVFTRIRFTYTVTGKNLKPETVERAVHLSAEKYCSASIMIGKTAEIVRERVFHLLHQELPYSITVETEAWAEAPDGKEIRIDLTVYVQRDSQKAIVLGKGGGMIRRIGEAARKELEAILEARIHLFLFVKVRENWQDDPNRYGEMGLDFPRR